MSVSKANPPWISTDPDCDQFGRQISKTIFEFKQVQTVPCPDKEHGVDRIPISAQIDLADYSDTILSDEIRPYGYTLGSIREVYGPNADFIMAECIFENQALELAYAAQQ